MHRVLPMARAPKGPPPPSDPEQGIYQGRSVAKRIVSADGWTILVGRSAEDNDTLTVRLAEPKDFWLHVASESGSHVVIRNPDGEARPPKETLQHAAGLAAGHSRAREGGRVAVHYAQKSDVRKPRGFAPGKVELARYKTVHAAPRRD
ncbi:MAG: NFACT RNA binding domain-containing protein [Candidatus Binatia bacterium]|nr:NFACT RNA binding domain-containing protein [Candidatus Binatia bacterium]